jgi:hypothetical protein
MKLVLTHIGNPIPEYVYCSLAHLRIANPLVDVDFILNKKHYDDITNNIFSKFNITPIESEQFDNDENIINLNKTTWIKKKHPLAPTTTYPGQPNFWHLAMERIFYLNAYLNTNKINNVLHIENDNVIFYDINILNQFVSTEKITCVHRTHDGEDSTLFSFAHIPTYQTLNNLCLFMNELVAMGESYLQSKYGFDHISEMHLLTVYRKLNMLNIFPILPNENIDFVFDPFGYAAFLFGSNNFRPPGYFDTSDSIGQKISQNSFNIIMNDKKPYLISNNKTYKIFNLHMHRKNISNIL